MCVAMIIGDRRQHMLISNWFLKRHLTARYSNFCVSRRYIDESGALHPV